MSCSPRAAASGETGTQAGVSFTTLPVRFRRKIRPRRFAARLLAKRTRHVGRCRAARGGSEVVGKSTKLVPRHLWKSGRRAHGLASGIERHGAKIAANRFVRRV